VNITRPLSFRRHLRQGAFGSVGCSAARPDFAHSLLTLVLLTPVQSCVTALACRHGGGRRGCAHSRAGRSGSPR
jgi:hypothetical protein